MTVKLSTVMNDTFEYDVAFSFLAQDEHIALQLHKLIKGSVKSFIYSDEQKKLAGKDGEVTFNKVFNEESRIPLANGPARW
jgi:hypothetical protein